MTPEEIHDLYHNQLDRDSIESVYCYTTFTGKYMDKYVEWLEQKIIKHDDELLSAMRQGFEAARAVGEDIDPNGRLIYLLDFPDFEDYEKFLRRLIYDI